MKFSFSVYWTWLWRCAGYTGVIPYSTAAKPGVNVSETMRHAMNRLACEKIRYQRRNTTCGDCATNVGQRFFTGQWNMYRLPCWILIYINWSTTAGYYVNTFLFVHNSPLYVWFQVFSVVYLFACVSVFICMKPTVCIVWSGIVEFNVPLDTVLGHFGDGSTVCNFNPWSGWVITESMSLYHQSLHLASNCIVVVIVSLCCILVDTNKQHCSAGT